MARTKRKLPYKKIRHPRRNRAYKGEVRNKALPPSPRDDIQFSNDVLLAQRLVRRLYNAGKDIDEIVKAVINVTDSSYKEAYDYVLKNINIIKKRY